jgi:hypothetical protein
MAATLTEKEFSKHVNTKFRASRDAESLADLKLVEVKGYRNREDEQQGMERFSIYFTGPINPFMPQSLYRLEHEVMGEFEIFLVPLARDGQGFRYEAVYNYFQNREGEE